MGLIIFEKARQFILNNEAKQCLDTLLDYLKMAEDKDKIIKRHLTKELLVLKSNLIKRDKLIQKNVIQTIYEAKVKQLNYAILLFVDVVQFSIIPSSFLLKKEKPFIYFEIMLYEPAKVKNLNQVYKLLLLRSSQLKIRINADNPCKVEGELVLSKTKKLESILSLHRIPTVKSINFPKNKTWKKYIKAINDFQMDLTATNFTNERIQQQSLIGIKLKEAYLIGAKLHQVNLLGADFRKTNAQGIQFSKVDLRYSSFKEANLKQANFQASDLSNSKFNYANLQEATFTASNLHRACFIGADLCKATFHKVNLSTAKLLEAKAYHSDKAALLAAKANISMMTFVEEKAPASPISELFRSLF